MASLTIDAKAGYGKVDFTRETDNYILVEIKGGSLNTEIPRPPLEIIAVVDTSSSMATSMKMENVKKSLRLMVEHMSPQDSLSIVEYASDVRVAVSGEKTDMRSKQAIFHAIGAMQPSGMTNFSAALGMAFDAARKQECGNGSVQRIIFFTDGCPTSGNTNPQDLISLSRTIPHGWQLTTMGYGFAEDSSKNSALVTPSMGMGGEVNLDLLERMAEAGNGNFYYMKDADSAARAFANELGGLITTVAQEIRITVRPDQSRITLKEVLEDLDVDDKGDAVEIHIPDVLAEEIKLVTLAVTCKKQKAPETGSTSVAIVGVQFLDTPNGEVRTIQISPMIQWVEPGKEEKQLDPDVATQLAVLQAIKAQEDAFQKAQAGDFAAASAVINGAAGTLRSVGTLRAMGFAACVANMGVMLKDKGSFLRKRDEFAASAHEARKGRATGGAFMRFFSTAAQRMTQDSFADRWDDADLQSPQPDVSSSGESATGNRSKKSTVQRY